MEEKLPVNSLYLHYPFCRHLCNYCDFYKSVPKNEDEVLKFESLLDSMFVENQKLIESNGYKWGELNSVYIGGGTPSLWGSRGSRYLESKLSSYDIKLSQNVEFTLEVNPGSWDIESLSAWNSIGVNRFSLGIQSINPTFIKLLDRVHSIDDVYETLDHFNKINANFSVDFMLGLPHSQKYSRDILSELKEILSYNPSHISLYILTVKDHYIHHGALPDEEWIEQEYLSVSDFLKGEGYQHYEVSNFALKGHESFHNLEYWKMNSVAALGPSATGFLAGKNLRYKWKTQRSEFKTEPLNEEEFRLEQVYMGLRINIGLHLKYKSSDITSIANSWQERGLATVIDEKIYLSSKGYLVLDSLMDELFSKAKDFFKA